MSLLVRIRAYQMSLPLRIGTRPLPATPSWRLPWATRPTTASANVGKLSAVPYKSR